MKFIEMFAGIGGFRLGLENQGHKCVWANEWLKNPRGIYEYNFKEVPNEKDIRNISARDVPDAELIVGGFPCATFSVAGKRTGFSLEDTRGTLCFEMFRIANEKRIPYILFENVKGLLNHDSGRTFAVILSALDEMGYDSQWELLDSQYFGVAQHRERIFLIANLRGEPKPKVFPIGQTGTKNDGTDTTEVSQWRRTHFRDYKGGGVPTLTANMGTGGHNVPFIKATITPDRANKRQNGRRFKEDGEPSFTLGAQDRHGVLIDDGIKTKIRKLTPLECERLQGLPDNFTKYRLENGAVVENSDSERYERCGRTVTIPVIEAIGKKLGKEWYA